MPEPQGLHEDRTRITCHLPLNNEAEHRAVHAIFTYLQALRRQPLGVKGFTHTAARPAAVFGDWWSSSRRRWVRDKLVLCIVDYKLPFSSPDLSRVVRELKEAIHTQYARVGSPQEEVWVVAQQIVRQD